MTTIGVATHRHDNPKEACMSSYSYPINAGRRIQLVSVKEGIFHPRLPTLRHLERDRTLHKLPDEHCRTSLPALTTEAVDFKRATTVDPAALKTRDLDKDAKKEPRYTYQYTPEELKRTRYDWSEFLTRCPERFRINLTEHPDTANTPYTGYAMRYLKPDVTAKWRYNLTSEPNIDSYGQRPTPADELNRYRNVHARTAASVSTDPWKPPYKNHWAHM